MGAAEAGREVRGQAAVRRGVGEAERSLISTSMGVALGWGRGGGGEADADADALGLGGRGAVRRVEERVGGVRAWDWGRRGVAGRVVGGGGCWGAPRGGTEVLFELVAVGGAELDAGWVAAQHWRMR